MDVEVSRATGWKAMHAANHHLHETIDAGNYPVAWRIRILLDAWDASVGNDETSWTREARGLEDVVDEVLVEMAELEGTTRISVDEGLVERVRAVARAERPDVPVEDRSFDENLRTVLEAWNEFYGRNGAGWRE